ncbi:MAG: alpha/beta hydrolase [Candidatus Melainabacteria bacterium]|nr:alpha/beta hydrolase [Candidatus Melainabacteria bacterium]
MIVSFIRSLLQELTAAFKPGEWNAVVKKLQQTNRRTFLLTIRNLIPQLLIYYILLSPIVAAPLYNMMLFHPSMAGTYNARSIIDTKIENVHFTSRNGSKLHGWYLPAIQGKGVVLISHGNGGNLTNRMPLIAMFLRQGMSVFIYDYQGYGLSNGTPSITKMKEDGAAAFDWLLSNKHYSEQDIVVFGESLGTGIACQLAAKKKVAGIILQSPYISLRDLARLKIFWLRLYPDALFSSQDQLDNLKLLEQPHAPLLLVHGAHDKVIPITCSEKLFSLAQPQKTFVRLENASHNDIYDVDFEQYTASVHEFLRALVSMKTDY